MDDFDLVLRIDSLDEYKEFICDLINIGTPTNNPFDRRIDADNLSIMTHFAKADPLVLEEHIGLVATLVSENEEDYCQEEIEIESPEHVTFKGHNIPTEEDFPIIISWYQEDSFDRMGSVGVRLFEWMSIDKTPTYRSKTFPKTRALWEERYKEERKRLYREE
jgi:hypothetical protein